MNFQDHAEGSDSCSGTGTLNPLRRPARYRLQPHHQDPAAGGQANAITGQQIASVRRHRDARIRSMPAHRHGHDTETDNMRSAGNAICAATDQHLFGDLRGHPEVHAKGRAGSGCHESSVCLKRGYCSALRCATGHGCQNPGAVLVCVRPEPGGAGRGWAHSAGVALDADWELPVSGDAHVGSWLSADS
jgi:hypothetical protein